jgi:hypothetical protein
MSDRKRYENRCFRNRPATYFHRLSGVIHREGVTRILLASVAETEPIPPPTRGVPQSAALAPICENRM